MLSILIDKLISCVGQEASVERHRADTDSPDLSKPILQHEWA